MCFLSFLTLGYSKIAQPYHTNLFGMVVSVPDVPTPSSIPVSAHHTLELSDIDRPHPIAGCRRLFLHFGLSLPVRESCLYIAYSSDTGR